MRNRGLEISLMSTEVFRLAFVILTFDMIKNIIAIENDSLVRTVWSIVTEARTFF